MWKQVWSGMLAAVLALTAGAWGADASSDTPPSEEPAHRENGDRSVAKPGRPDKGPAIDLGEFWIGLECFPAPPPLVEQLDLSDEGGLLVGQVLPGSPAEEAGLKRHDVLVRADGKPIPQITDLLAAVNKSEGKELKLDLIRGGKPMTMAVTPVERPRGEQPRIWQEPPRDEDFNRLWQWFGRMGADEEWRRPFRMHFFHPGAILPPGAELQPALPADMTIIIRKQGEESTKITVKRGEDSWEVTEQELQKLPDDVRPHVERMLGRLPMAGREFRVIPWRPGKPEDLQPESEPSDVLEQPLRDADRIEQQLERQLDEMGSRLEKMRRSLDRWRGDRDARPELPERPRIEQPDQERPSRDDA